MLEDFHHLTPEQRKSRLRITPSRQLGSARTLWAVMIHDDGGVWRQIRTYRARSEAQAFMSAILAAPFAPRNWYPRKGTKGN